MLTSVTEANGWNLLYTETYLGAGLDLFIGSEFIDSVYGGADPTWFNGKGLAMKYRLITLLAAVTLAAIGLAAVRFTLIEPVLRREQAVAELREAGAQVGYPSPAIVDLHPGMHMYRREYQDAPLVKGPEWAINLFGERYFHSPVTTVDFGEAKNQVSADDLEVLGSLPQIQLLDLTHGVSRDCPAITDEAIEHVVGLGELQALYVKGSQITDSGVQRLSKGLPALVALNLDSTAITDKSIEPLSRLRALQLVSVRWTKVTPEGVARLEKLRPDLRVLY